jgi:hypothetical protein
MYGRMRERIWSRLGKRKKERGEWGINHERL